MRPGGCKRVKLIADMYVYIYIHTYSILSYIYIYISIVSCMYIYIYVYMYMYLYLCAAIHVPISQPKHLPFPSPVTPRVLFTRFVTASQAPERAAHRSTVRRASSRTLTQAPICSSWSISCQRPAWAPVGTRSSRPSTVSMGYFLGIFPYIGLI